MQNALSPNGGPPPAPNPRPQAPATATGAVPFGGSPMAPGSPPGAPQAPPPPPNHQQTVAALRHFAAIERELSTLLADPDLGRADMKSKIIDGASSLVADGILTPAQAVTQLGNVPARPYDQKMWVMKNFAKTVQAQTLVVAHHYIGVANTPIPASPIEINADNHIATMQGLLSQYRGASRNAGA